MIKYEYTKFNQLEIPQKYEYTNYLGPNFINSYFSNRLEYVKKFKVNNHTNDNFKIYSNFYNIASNRFDLFFSQQPIDWLNFVEISNKDLAEEFEHFDDLLSFDPVYNIINTESLLFSMLVSQLNNRNDRKVKEWLDRLVQRYEVTKKLYSNYLIGFRKGEGGNDSVSLYWLFALSLALYYVLTSNIKYLNTLLKVNDLLCSLDANFLVEQIPLNGLSLVLSVEVASIKLLSENIKRVDFSYE